MVKIKWSRPVIGEGLHGTIGPEFYIFQDGQQWKLWIKDTRKRVDRQDKFIPVKSMKHGKRMAAEIINDELKRKGYNGHQKRRQSSGS